jgi:hypothetical protein
MVEMGGRGYNTELERFRMVRTYFTGAGTLTNPIALRGSSSIAPETKPRLRQ